MDPNDKFVLIRGEDEMDSALYKNGKLMICGEDYLILERLLKYLEVEEREDPHGHYLDSHWKALPTLQEVEVVQAKAQLEEADAVISTREEWERRVTDARKTGDTTFTVRLTPPVVLEALHSRCSLTEEEAGEEASRYTVTLL